jgi:hypothetical protein
MTRAFLGLRSVLVTGMVLGLGSVVGCGGDDGSASSASNAIGSNTGVINRPVTGGTPPTAPTDGQPDSAQPPVSSANTVTLSWDAPTDNADGTTLEDLKGYKVHYGTSSGSYTDTIDVSNPGLTTYVVQNVPSGTYYFAVTAFNSAGKESSLSAEIATQVVD